MRRVIGILVIAASCSSNPIPGPVDHKDNGLELKISPATRFPLVDYDAVELFSVDSMHYHVEDMAVLEKEILNAPYTDGMALIDSSGRPTTKHFTRYRVADSFVAELDSVFAIPKNNGEVTKAMCIPFYRDAFVFYRNQRQVAQAQICLHCKQAYFTLDTTDLAERFSSDGNWDRLHAFISKVKAH